MEFRLTYEGQLLSETNRDDSVKRSRANHKHEIRKVFHTQLKKLWEVTPFLKPHMLGTNPPRDLFRPAEENTLEGLAKRFTRHGYRFVPLATRSLSLFCDVDVLFLRTGSPGELFTTRTGDIDNRMKTLFDALCMPQGGAQLGKYTNPDLHNDEDPFFCLLEDDSLITKASIESDRLLQYVSEPPSENDVRLVITVRLKPASMGLDNLRFGA